MERTEASSDYSDSEGSYDSQPPELGEIDINEFYVYRELNVVNGFCRKFESEMNEDRLKEFIMVPKVIRQLIFDFYDLKYHLCTLELSAKTKAKIEEWNKSPAKSIRMWGSSISTKIILSSNKVRLTTLASCSAVFYVCKSTQDLQDLRYNLTDGIHCFRIYFKKTSSSSSKNSTDKSENYNSGTAGIFIGICGVANETEKLTNEEIRAQEAQKKKNSKKSETVKKRTLNRGGVKLCEDGVRVKDFEHSIMYSDLTAQFLAKHSVNQMDMLVDCKNDQLCFKIVDNWRKNREYIIKMPKLVKMSDETTNNNNNKKVEGNGWQVRGFVTEDISTEIQMAKIYPALYGKNRKLVDWPEKYKRDRKKKPLW